MTEEVQAIKGPALLTGPRGASYNGKSLSGAYLCKLHGAGLILSKRGEFTANGVTWKADPKNGYWIACCRTCKNVLKDARGKRFVCPIEEPQSEE